MCFSFHSLTRDPPKGSIEGSYTVTVDRPGGFPRLPDKGSPGLRSPVPLASEFRNLESEI